MLLIANGAFKSGSSWQFHILRQLTGFGPPPDEFRNKIWHPNVPSLDKTLLEAFLARGLHRNQDFLVKNHFWAGRIREKLLGDKDVFLVCIERDYRDVLVSMYFHYKRDGLVILRKQQESIHDPSMSFEDWYFTYGQKSLRHLWDYNSTWSISHKRLYMGKYERLIANFREEVRALAEFLNLEVTDATIDSIQAATSFQTLSHGRQPGEEDPDRFFRKGIVGDHVNHFTPAVWADYSQTMQEFAEKQRKALVSQPLSEMDPRVQALTEENKDLLRELNQLQNSLSWKITEPLRVGKRALLKLKR